VACLRVGLEKNLERSRKLTKKKQNLDRHTYRHSVAEKDTSGYSLRNIDRAVFDHRKLRDGFPVDIISPALALGLQNERCVQDGPGWFAFWSWSWWVRLEVVNRSHDAGILGVDSVERLHTLVPQEAFEHARARECFLDFPVTCELQGQ
jgi:hypothetical protein